MATLHLGVVDVGYFDNGKGTTTGDVAGYLEAQYHIMQIFYELNQEFISKAIANDLAGSLENAMSGGGFNNNFEGSMEKIGERFRDFISSGEMQKILPLTQPIKAADAGVSHRKKTPYAKDNPSRVAFVDSGLFVSTFKAWLTGKLN